MAATAVAAIWGIGFASEQRVANQTTRTETATFAGGCFWSLEAAFRQVKGVTDTVVGYTGGTSRNPTYETVSSRRADHLEACRVTFDPAQISYKQLVEYFFRIHSPSALGRKDPYLGSPARLVIFFRNAEQERVTQAVKQRLQPSEATRRFPVVDILSEGEFYRAEEYHQRYLERHGLASCHSGP